MIITIRPFSTPADITTYEYGFKFLTSTYVTNQPSESDVKSEDFDSSIVNDLS